jgi:putative thioredoxin
MDQPMLSDVTETTFEQDVLLRSHEVPVVVDFWAEWCGPCRTLGPTLERLAGAAGGAWVLAQVDVDSSPSLATAFGIQGIPAVCAFRDGRQVAEFTGALPEDQVRAWLEQLGPSAADRAAAEAVDAALTGDHERAAALFRDALRLEPGHAGARAGLARAELHLRTSSLDEAELTRRADADPTDVDAALGLADLAATSNRREAAFERLVEVVRLTAGHDRERARRRLVELLDTVPADDPAAMKARRALALALH